MSAPAPDDLAGGPSRDPVRVPGWLRGAALVLLAGLAGWSLLSQDGPSALPTASQRSDSAPAAVLPPRPLVLGSQPGLLGVRAVCVRADHEHDLWLGVDLVNGRLARTTLLAVTPVEGAGSAFGSEQVLPARRTCDRRRTARDSLVMFPGGTVPVRLRLPRADRCRAAPTPISVRVDVSFLGPGERPETQRLNLHPDPGEVDLVACGRT
jgi:hypothetical protein